MKRSRFSEEQIIGILKKHRAGAGREGAVPQAWDHLTGRLLRSNDREGAMRRSTSGAPSMAAWRCQTRGG
ncbi:hypothetical protein PhaeoP18_02290 [Phaeobacter piscinae]|nr:hypothetical protein PhaeoP18_02290 [Phaeobacter piscinae]